MKPNPLSSLNHFTVPVGICGTPPRYLRAVARRVLLRASPASACTAFRRLSDRPDSHETSRSDRGRVGEMLRRAVRVDRLTGPRRRRFRGARIGLQPMSAAPAADGAQPAAEARPVMRRLLPPGADTDPEAFVEALEIASMPVPEGRPRVLLNMASTADGRASLAGRSGPIGNRADHGLFHALRAAVDAILVGAGTVRTERYGRVIRDAGRRRARRERGLSEEPLAGIVSASLDLPADLPLLSEPAARVVILTPSEKVLDGVSASVEYVRAGAGEECELTVALAELRARFAVRT